MGVVFLFIGIAAVAIGVRGQASAAGQLLASEFTGPNSYVEWLAAIVLLGLLGFWKPARPFANGFLGLLILAMFLRKGQGFFDQLNSAITSAQPSPKGSGAASAAGTTTGSAAGNLLNLPGATPLSLGAAEAAAAANAAGNIGDPFALSNSTGTYP